MQNAEAKRALKLASIVIAGALLEWLGATNYLWVFPLVFPGLGLWLLFACGDILLLRSAFSGIEQARLLLWGTGLSLFAAYGGFPLTGVFLVLAPAALWALSRHGNRILLKAAVPVLFFIFFLGHDENFFHWNLDQKNLGWRFSVHLVALFAFFRACSWLAAVAGRGERPSFTATMEYFIAPAFWLSPLHASHLIWARMQEETHEEGDAFLWIVRGLFHAVCLSLVCRLALPWLGGLYGGGIKQIFWYEWLSLGPVLFLLAYLDKSQVSYLVAGFLRLSGKNIEPDFRSPWLAFDLLDYWRRFHYWLWEFYMDVLYPILLVPLSRRMRAEFALPLALFFSFSLGTGSGHFLSYRAGLGMSLALGAFFGLATMLHYYLRLPLKSRWIGIPATWLTIFLLYSLAYPVFGLGWGFAEFRQFFGS
ncbi:MAG: hypothetical protein AB7K68_10565 [Bacteriovoracia bacterium]